MPEPQDAAGQDPAGREAPGQEAPGDEGTGRETPGPEPRPDGLDLARAAARAAARGPLPSSSTRKRLSGTPGTPASARRRTRHLSGAGPDERDPQLLEDAMQRLVASHGWELDLKVQGVFGRWAELVGTEVADHCTPETLADGRLVVRTDSTAWATQLRLLAPAVVRRLNAELGHGTVTVIEVLGPHVPSWKKGRLGVRDGRGPRDTYG